MPGNVERQAARSDELVPRTPGPRRADVIVANPIPHSPICRAVATSCACRRPRSGTTGSRWTTADEEEPCERNRRFWPMEGICLTRSV